MNALAEGNSFLAVSVFAVSDDENLLAYSTDVTGFREYTLHIKDLRSETVLADRIEKVEAAAWASDSRTLLYTIEDEAKRPYRLLRHTLGEPEDILLYEESDAKFVLDVARSRSRAYFFATSVSSDTSEVRYLPTDQTSGRG